MPGKPWTDEEDAIIERIYRAYNGRGAWARAAAKQLPGRTRDTVSKRWGAIKDNPRRVATITDEGDTKIVEWAPRERITSLDQLLKIAKIDPDVWEVEKHVVNKWEVGTADRKMWRPGAEKGERFDTKVVVEPLFQVKAWLKRKVPARQINLLTQLLDDIRHEKRRPKAPAFIRSRTRSSGFLFEFPPFDLHLGKLAWAEETVTNYDMKYGTELFTGARDYLLDRALAISGGKLERTLTVFGNDASHADSKKGETTGGTRMDMDSRYTKVYRRLCELHRDAILRLREVAPVDVVIVPGNHDELTSFHLGEYLAAYFHHDRHVRVNNSARLRKYYDFGINLFGFAHGDAERVNELPLLMAREVPALWAKCASREWHIGHKHIEEKWEASSRRRVTALEQDLFSDKGIRIRRLASLSGHDAWHTKHGYTDRRACDAFVFHREAGFTAHLSFNVDHFTGKAAKGQKAA